MFYIVSTPIGNLEDITLRAVRILQEVDVIVCEDSRVTAKLLSKYGINKPLFVYNDHSNVDERDQIIQMLKNNKKIALVTDAGTPLISDPGYKLIISAQQHNIKVTTVPGACSIIAALSVSGLPSDKFYFFGYLPPKTNGRIKELQKLKDVSASLIFLESPHRLYASLCDMLSVLGNRKICVARELTKLYEEIITDSLENLIEKYKNGTKGEIVIIVDGNDESQINVTEEQMEIELAILLKQYSARDASLLMHQKYKLPRKYFYDKVNFLIK